MGKDTFPVPRPLHQHSTHLSKVFRNLLLKEFFYLIFYINNYNLAYYLFVIKPRRVFGVLLLYFVIKISYYLPCFFSFLNATHVGAAMKIEEYVPAIRPIISASEKSLIASTPKKYKRTIVIKVVTDVFIERVIV